MPPRTKTGAVAHKLDSSQHDQLIEMLQGPPEAVGYDAEAWTPALVQQCLADWFDVAYSKPSCRRLMKEAGLRYERSVPPEDGGGQAGQAWVPQ